MTLWYLRALEQQDGQWACRFGPEQFGTYPTLTSALQHMAEAAIALGGRELFSFHLYRRDGSFERRLGSDPVPGE
jgi:hypothetical protein